MEKNYFTNLNNFDKILNTYFQRRSYLLKGDNENNYSKKISAKDKIREKFSSMKQKCKDKILRSNNRNKDGIADTKDYTSASINKNNPSQSAFPSTSLQPETYLGKLKSYYNKHSAHKDDYMERLKLYYKTKKEKFYNKKENFQNYFHYNFQKVFDEREKTKMHKSQTRYSLLFLFTLSNIYFILKKRRISLTFLTLSGLFFINLNIIINYKIKLMYKKRMKVLGEELFSNPKSREGNSAGENNNK